MSSPPLRIGEILLKEGLITQQQLNLALAQQKKEPHQSLGIFLVRQGAVSEKILVMTLSKQLNIPYASREKNNMTPAPDQNLAKLVPEEFARRHCVLPLSIDGNKLVVAFMDPLDVVLVDNLHKITGCEISRMIASRADIELQISAFYGEGGMLKYAIQSSYAATEAAVSVVVETEDRLSLDDLVASAEKAPVVKLTDLLIRQAIKQRASDIHIEPFDQKISIRFRIDGALHEIPPPDKSMILPLTSRIKILCKMDIAEKRLPQDGSFRATIENRLIDFRVSTIPTIHGEKVVLRILDRSAVALDLSTLGFTPHELETFIKCINKPYGMILITGPTGSGKTTTLYSALNEIKGDAKNITTIEDPVEYQLNGINQVQVKAGIGLTFASGLRAFLRQDPDVMLVGETRDLETAQICVRAALTGHLVFTTLHTNDAPGAISRLVDIGIEPFFVSSSLLMVVAQRLIRKLCPKCKEAYKPIDSELPSLLKIGAGKLETIYRSKGCEHCNKTGYAGRMPIFEMMAINDEIAKLILKRASVLDIREAARRNGMSTLEESCLRKVADGLTSLEEMMRVVLSTD